MARDADDLLLRREEAALARRAAEGDGSAFAELYDRYERRIYTFCHRLVGSEHDAADATQEAFVKVLDRLPKLRDRELHFAGYLFTAARNASYDMIGKRTRTEAVDEIPEMGAQPVYGDAGDRLDLDPERAAMLGAMQEQVQVAHARLPDRQRDVLALRELQELSYDEIGEIMGMKRNAVAQLISRARIRLRTELQVGAVAAVRPTTPEEERIAALIAARMDGELEDPSDVSWLRDQLRENPRARLMEESLLEAGTSYRGIAWVVPLAWLRDATIAEASERIGADWSAQMGTGVQSPGAAVSSPPTAVMQSLAPASESAATAAVEEVADSRRRRGMYAVAAVGILLLFVLGTQLLARDSSERPVRAGATATTPSTTTATATATTSAPARTATSTALAPTTAASPASTPVATSVAQPDVVPASGAPQTTRTPRPSPARISDEGGQGSGQQGAGRAPLPDTPPPAPAPAPAPAPEPEPAPPATTPPATTPPATTPTVPCRPTVAAGQCPPK